MGQAISFGNCYIVKLYFELGVLIIPVLLEAVTRRFSVKKMFLEISQNSQENNCAGISFLIETLWHSCFPVNFAKFLRTTFLTEHLRWLLLFFFLKAAQALLQYLIGK